MLGIVMRYEVRVEIGGFISDLFISQEIKKRMSYGHPLKLISVNLRNIL